MPSTKHIILAFLLFACGGICSFASTITDETTFIESSTIGISINRNSIRITNATGQVLEIYNITGVKVASYKIDSADKIIPLNQLSKSCYILKVGNIVRKISIF